jgi:hypothetical protein
MFNLMRLFRKPATHSLHILDQTGDTPVLWNPADARSTRKAEEVFERLVRGGYLTYRADEDPTVIRTFDPQAETIIARFPMAGG